MMPHKSTAVHIAAVLGTLRPNNYTSRLLNFTLEELRGHSGVTIDVVDPAKLDLALPGQPGAPALQAELVTRINNATAVILATPEYHGSYSSVLKVLIDNMGYPSALAGKPVALIGVASGVIGAVKSLEHLRSVCSHVGAIVLPYPVSVAGVEQLFSPEGQGRLPLVEEQLRNVAVQLLAYLRGRHGLVPFEKEVVPD
ncbi:MAG: NAD(P)H-dependent oxidoreductase [Candidatus Hydrogenedentes bacterium]|nr:NAD(P)H-dependent oxidoreductase [Candidatus Hydrogenedentota bacterium]